MWGNRVGRLTQKVRKLARLGEIALVEGNRNMVTNPKHLWSVWEVGGEHKLRWMIASGATPEDALKEALRVVRAMELRRLAEEEN